MVTSRAAILTVLLLFLVAACSGGAATDAPPPSFDPPLGFAAATGRLPSSTTTQYFSGGQDLPATLAGTSVWMTDGGRLERVDSVGTAAPVALPAGVTVAGRPWSSADGAQVLAAATAVIPGQGTTPPGLAVELVVVDAASATVTATIPATLPWNDRPGSIRLAVSGSPSGIAVVSAHTDAQRTTIGVDIARRRTLWSADGVDASAMLPGAAGGPVVVGTTTPSGQSRNYAASSVVGLDARTGARRFGVFEGARAVRGATVTTAGPALVAVSGRETTSGSLLGSPASLLFVGADGGVRRTESLGSSLTASPPRCVWDEAATTVCSVGTRVLAVDATTAAPLWSLPDPTANRVAPTVTTAWHGAVYGTTVNGPVVLDARTGADRDRAPGVAPILVDGYLAVATETGVAGVGGRSAIHPAVR